VEVLRFFIVYGNRKHLKGISLSRSDIIFRRLAGDVSDLKGLNFIFLFDQKNVNRLCPLVVPPVNDDDTDDEVFDDPVRDGREEHVAPVFSLDSS
jgi:hypothetical protein